MFSVLHDSLVVFSDQSGSSFFLSFIFHVYLCRVFFLYDPLFLSSSLIHLPYSLIISVPSFNLQYIGFHLTFPISLISLSPLFSHPHVLHISLFLVSSLDLSLVVSFQLTCFSTLPSFELQSIRFISFPFFISTFCASSLSSTYFIPVTFLFRNSTYSLAP
jgi:hypothetical protein